MSNITIKPGHVARISGVELEQKGCHYFHTKVDNKIIIVETKEDIVPHTFVMEIKTKVPLYKQSMQMQMGRQPQTHTIDKRTYRVVPTKVNKIQYFEYWVQTTP